ncbi:SLAM family member 9-like isoform X1 [Manis javanica]|uniref:SLAM family member 9-like isoform X1 n=1 Tax=Manis javanica TaxID=9974 RepID=UPI003C6D3BB0
MGSCSGDPRLCWATWLLRCASLLLSACSTVANSSGAHGSGVMDSGAHVFLNRTQGSCVLFHAAREAGAELKDISWGFGPDSAYTVILQVHSGADSPTWVSLRDKYEHRVHVPNMTSLRIDNLTCEDSGQYRARVSLTGGREFNMNFHLTVYAPVPLPQIWVTSSSITPGWCNVTLECRAQGAMEDLKVTWESKGLPEELEQRGIPGPAPNSWTLDLSLPLSQPNPRLTCVLSNPLDQKTATTDLGAICVPAGSHAQTSARTLPGILGATVTVLLILGAGLWLWKMRGKKKMETGRGAGLQEAHRDEDGGVHYAELSPQVPHEGRDKEPSGSHPQGIGEQHLQDIEPLKSVYSVVHKPGQVMKMI